MNDEWSFLKPSPKKIKYAEKAMKGQPYLRLTFFDGSTSIICGKLCDLPNMLRVNRATVVSRDASFDLVNKHLKIKGGPAFVFSRRMWEKYRPNITEI